MNRINGTALLSLFFGLFAGSGIGWLALNYYHQPIIIIPIASFIIGTVGFFVGSYIRKTGADASFEKPSNLAAVIAVAVLAVSGVFSGITTHTPDLAYFGLIGVFTVLMMMPESRTAITRSAGAMGICIVALIASFLSRERSWLIVAVLSGLAAIAVLYARYQKHDEL